MNDKKLSNLVAQRVVGMTDSELSVVSITELSRLLGVDRFKLSRRFLQEMGMPLKYFIMQEKMSRATLLLVDKRKFSMKEIAERIGFSTSDYFIRIFRQHFGIGPGKYRDCKTHQPSKEETHGEGKSKRRATP
ncbi:MAG: helix-turn-helix transcriptional regulator [Candidatus Omnitrophota bacterium]